MAPPPSAVTDIDRAIEELWAESIASIVSIDSSTENWKAQVLPLARIKKIMKSEEAIYVDLDSEKNGAVDAANGVANQRFMIAGEAPVLLGKACELLVKELTIRAWRHTERNRRRTLQKQDVHAAVGESEVYDFLIDIVPRVVQSVPPPAKPFGADQVAGDSTSAADGGSIARALPSAPSAEVGTSAHLAEIRLAQLQHMQEQYFAMQQQQIQMQRHIDQTQQATAVSSTMYQQPTAQMQGQSQSAPPSGSLGQQLAVKTESEGGNASTATPVPKTKTEA